MADPRSGGPLAFRVVATSAGARRGSFTTSHGTVQTPAFMPVGTQATVKAVTPDQVAETGAEVVLANTYHLGSPERVALIERLGGLHAAMRWDRTILTDSGGFQVFSLPEREIFEEGVRFALPGSEEQILLSPETSMAIQRALGADIVMAFDECVAYPSPRAYVAASVDRTLRWLKRCMTVTLAPHQHLFGIVQGGVEEDLRQQAVEQVCSCDLPGYAIGGVSVGEGLEILDRVVGWTAPLLPPDRPRYLMGVGLPEDLLVSIGHGMDMFDCVIPTRYAREGTVFTWRGRMRLRDKRYRKDRYPIDTACRCYACRQGFSRAYMRHLFFANEILGQTLATIHNLTFYQDLMMAARQAIEDDRFTAWVRSVRAEMTAKGRS